MLVGEYSIVDSHDIRYSCCCYLMDHVSKLQDVLGEKQSRFLPNTHITQYQGQVRFTAGARLFMNFHKHTATETRQTYLERRRVRYITDELPDHPARNTIQPPWVSSLRRSFLYEYTAGTSQIETCASKTIETIDCCDDADRSRSPHIRRRDQVIS